MARKILSDSLSAIWNMILNSSPTSKLILLDVGAISVIAGSSSAGINGPKSSPQPFSRLIMRTLPSNSLKNAFGYFIICEFDSARIRKKA